MRVATSICSASLPSPWNEYGEERGLKAPPRRIEAPADRTATAVSLSMARFSTEQGPAMMVSSLPPMTASAPTRTTVRFTANSREASLYGLSTGITDSTPGIERSGSSMRRVSSPMQPMMVRCSPRERCV